LNWDSSWAAGSVGKLNYFEHDLCSVAAQTAKCWVAVTEQKAVQS